MIILKKLLITAAEDFGNGKEYEYEAVELPNGLVIDVCESTHGSVFEDRKSIEANGNDVIVKVEDNGTTEWSLEEIQSELCASAEEFDYPLPQGAGDYVVKIDYASTSNHYLPYQVCTSLMDGELREKIHREFPECPV